MTPAAAFFDPRAAAALSMPAAPAAGAVLPPGGAFADLLAALPPATGAGARTVPGAGETALPAAVPPAVPVAAPVPLPLTTPTAVAVPVPTAPVALMATTAIIPPPPAAMPATIPGPAAAMPAPDPEPAAARPAATPDSPVSGAPIPVAAPLPAALSPAMPGPEAAPAEAAASPPTQAAAAPETAAVPPSTPSPRPPATAVSAPPAPAAPPSADAPLPAVPVPSAAVARPATPRETDPEAVSAGRPVKPRTRLGEVHDVALAATDLPAQPLPPAVPPIPTAIGKDVPKEQLGDKSEGAFSARQPVLAAVAAGPADVAVPLSAAVGDAPPHPTAPGVAATPSQPASSFAAVRAAIDTPVLDVTARPEQIARDAGLAIVHRIRQGGEDLMIRVAPAELGVIDVRLSFDDQGSVRAVFAADSPAVVDLLRSASADLGRAVSQGGVPTDAASFRFESRGDGRGQQQHHAPPQPRWAERDDDPDDTSAPVFRPLRWRGGVDLRA